LLPPLESLDLRFHPIKHFLWRGTTGGLESAKLRQRVGEGVGTGTHNFSMFNRKVIYLLENP